MYPLGIPLVTSPGSSLGLPLGPTDDPPKCLNTRKARSHLPHVASTFKKRPATGGSLSKPCHLKNHGMTPHNLIRV